MNITQEKIDDLNALLKVEVSTDDYQEKVEKTIKDHQKKMNIPGFRPGKVPTSVIKKMYGKSIMLDEINKIVIDSMYDYLRQNNIDILGNPLPNKEKSSQIDWDNQTNFEFFYDLGLSPNIELKPLEELETKLYEISVNDEVVEKYLTEVRRRYGKFTNPEDVTDGDLIYCEFTELDEKGNIKDGGINYKSSIALELIKNKTAKKKFIGLKKEQEIDIDIVKTFDNNKEVSLMLNIEESKVAELKDLFKIKVLSINRVELAPLDKELFDKVYKNDTIETEEQLRERIKKDATLSFNSESEKLFVNEIVELLIKQTKITLPDTFLKRWLLETNNEKFTEEQIEKEYSIYADSLKWQLIENKILKDNEITVTQEDVKNHIKDYFRSSLPSMDEANPFPEDKLDSLADRLFENKEETKRIYDKIYDDRLKELFKNKLKVKKEQISYEEFVKLAESKHNHSH
ncbi:MAG TPA: trigger factor [Bacteroidales bacterium]|nr:trigger factor [Bacteroidales bacterium]HQI45613.1 trigger factor [Bacteroidales bacterium]